MTLEETLYQAFHMIVEQLQVGTLAWYVVLGLMLGLSVYYVVRGLFILKKRAVESKMFVVLCVPLLVWAGVTLIGVLDVWPWFSESWKFIALFSSEIAIPALLLLHIWGQTSYKPITAQVWVAVCAVPAACIAAEAYYTFADGALTQPVQAGMPIVQAIPGSLDQFVSFGEVGGALGIFLSFATTVYFIVAVAKCYLLCFNVLYQMPKHMRRSTHQMIIAISVIVVTTALTRYSPTLVSLSSVIVMFSYMIMLYALYTAFFIANSSNVIVTSRDFVFSSLSTIVITVSLKGNILDWNRKTKGGCAPLPDPQYKESYKHYVARIISTCAGVISPHDENIMTTNVDGVENHFQFTWHGISHASRKFGYLVEISEITKSYSVLRYLEDIALVDTLTGIRNRNAYIDAVKKIALFENMPLLVLVGDVNNLKLVNDTLGHLQGDRLLITITNAVQSLMPKDAHVFRIGGDEIAMLVPHADVDVAERFVLDVRAVLDTVRDPDFGTPSISWGYAVMRSLGDDYNEVFRTADAVMYESKKQSKTRASLSGIVPINKPEPAAGAVPVTPAAPDLPDSAPRQAAGVAGSPGEL